MNLNYQMNQRENKNNRNFNNNMNMNKKTSIVKNLPNHENKYNDNNKENINNYEFEDCNEVSNEISNTDNFFDDKEIIGKKLNRKRRGRRKSSNSNSSNKNNSLPLVKTMDVTNNNANNLNTNLDSAINDNYYFLRDIKSKKIKCKGLFEIIHSTDELYLIVLLI